KGPRMVRPGANSAPSPQLGFFGDIGVAAQDPALVALKDRMSELDTDMMTPMQALTELAALKQSMKDTAKGSAKATVS
ncbi:MAG: hypothetical protein ABI852_20430, partial [Gemmatimonadaceae bacterium]